MYNTLKSDLLGKRDYAIAAYFTFFVFLLTVHVFLINNFVNIVIIKCLKTHFSNFFFRLKTS